MIRDATSIISILEFKIDAYNTIPIVVAVIWL